MLRQLRYQWRMKYLSHNYGKVLENPKEDPILRKSLEPRLRQVTLVLLKFLDYVPGVKDKFVKYMLQYSEKIKQERADSTEGFIANAILYHNDNEVEEQLTSKWITERLKNEFGFSKLSIQRTSGVIRVLDLDTKSQREGKKVHRVIQVDDQILTRLRQRYFVEKDVTSVTSVTAVTVSMEEQQNQKKEGQGDTGIHSFEKKKTEEADTVYTVTGVTGVTEKPTDSRELLEWMKATLDAMKTQVIATEDIHKITRLEVEQLNNMLSELSSKGDAYEPRPGFWGVYQ